jgi:hypothetical protein
MAPLFGLHAVVCEKKGGRRREEREKKRRREGKKEKDFFFQISKCPKKIKYNL